MTNRRQERVAKAIYANLDYAGMNFRDGLLRMPRGISGRLCEAAHHNERWSLLERTAKVIVDSYATCGTRKALVLVESQPYVALQRGGPDSRLNDRDEGRLDPVGVPSPSIGSYDTPELVKGVLSTFGMPQDP